MNYEWIERKSAVMDRYSHSSYFVGTQFRALGEDFDKDSRLDISAFATHGGALPILVQNVGTVGTAALSGLPQIEGHNFVATELELFLRQSGYLKD